MTIETVTLDYNSLLNKETDLKSELEKAFGNQGLGVCLIKNVPGLVEKRSQLLRLASVFANLQDSVKQECVHPESSFLFGWSHGKEIMNGKPDSAKGSYYNNPILDDPLQNQEYIQKYPEYGYPNVWPKQMPEFKEAFMSLGALIVDVGILLASHCDEYLTSTYPDIPSNFISNALKDSKTCKARLLHYFPQSSLENQDAMDSWCGLHIDHSLLTGLTSAMYMLNDENVLEEPENAGTI
jgi:isopenicillin N synthase-like dioxygenase